ncbi:MAG: hypothetical protein A2W95_01120 [Bacteroidetes bacterium GWA2_40_14]|nr:MAG: hypothetical protein A2W95_01120 [Bacteroidetes bacterium GWA2_40_14]
MKKRPIKLKSQLVLVNALSKALIILLLVFSIPRVVDRITLKGTDEDLVKKLDQVLVLVDSLGIGSFINADADFQAFGSYNILKEEYISIENLNQDTLINQIAYSQRIIEEVMVDYRVLSYSIQIEEQNYLIEIGRSIGTIVVIKKQMQRFAILFMLILLTITILIEFSIIQYFLRPFDIIIDKLRKTKHPSDFSYQVTKTNTYDFIYLEETIHNLMRKIEETFNNEREYISNVSHELFTPISIIKSKLDNIIMEGNLSEEDMLKVYESKQTLGRLTKMIRTLLMLSRIENEEYLLKEQVEVVGVLKNVIRELEDLVVAKGLQLEEDFRVPEMTITGNAELIFNMFYNLVNNALKYTETGRIRIESSQTETSYMLRIVDSGQGIEPENLPYIFTRFRKFKAGKDSFGLGLALAKKICDYHGIEVQVSSVLGQGTTFELRIPKV